LQEGETVLDLGSGAGFDCFLAAKEVGSTGRVIGVDMTPEMLDKARENAARDNFHNVEFRLGEIENLPVADNMVDVVISNCVINLSTDKPRVFSEIFRVMKPGGRFFISDIVLTHELPDKIKKSTRGYVGCISGALLKEEYMKNIVDAGFDHINIDKEVHFPVEMIVSDPSGQMIKKELHLTEEEVNRVADSILSITVSGIKS
jgi:SAM-dependent methyltransferase